MQQAELLNELFGPKQFGSLVRYTNPLLENTDVDYTPLYDDVEIVPDNSGFSKQYYHLFQDASKPYSRCNMYWKPGEIVPHQMFCVKRIGVTADNLAGFEEFIKSSSVSLWIAQRCFFRAPLSALLKSDSIGDVSERPIVLMPGYKFKVELYSEKEVRVSDGVAKPMQIIVALHGLMAFNVPQFERDTPCNIFVQVVKEQS